MSSWGEQTSIGDQTTDSRFEFWKSGFKECQLCHQRNIKEEVNSAGCRHNGDGYGTVFFICQNEGCGWKTSFLYDEADGGPYYYETRTWTTGGIAKPAPRVPSYHALTPYQIEILDKMRLVCPEHQVLQHMTTMPFHPDDIKRYLKTPIRRPVQEARAEIRQLTGLTSELKAKYSRIASLIPEAGVRNNMKEEGIAQADIDAFFAERNGSAAPVASSSNDTSSKNCVVL
jgi:hypothetical protein